MLAGGALSSAGHPCHCPLWLLFTEVTREVDNNFSRPMAYKVSMYCHLQSRNDHQHLQDQSWLSMNGYSLKIIPNGWRIAHGRAVGLNYGYQSLRYDFICSWHGFGALNDNRFESSPMTLWDIHIYGSYASKQRDDCSKHEPIMQISRSEPVSCPGILHRYTDTPIDFLCRLYHGGWMILWWVAAETVKDEEGKWKWNGMWTWEWVR